jgi:glycosyltransferase involved in cell wall biosynthesis
MHFKVVTPTRNSSKTLDRTIRSVLSQTFDGEITYHIQDCLSTDETADIAARWINTLKQHGNPLGPATVKLSFDSRNDTGMYHGIHTGFEALDLKEGEDDWLSWINSDDTFCTYAFSAVEQVSLASPSTRWIGGSAAVMKNNIPLSTANRRLSSQFIREGLADGQYCDFVQQEGTFFKQSLYKDCDSYNAFGGLKHAGDWNLWRMFAYRADLVQISEMPLAHFHITEQQISQAFREAYLTEIEQKVPERKRRSIALSLMEKTINYYTCKFEWPSGRPTIRKEHGSLPLKERCFLRNQQEACISNQHKPKHPDNSDVIASLRKGALEDGNIAIHNHKWQYPAITEKKSAELASKIVRGFKHTNYIGFPWATLIDLLNANKSTAEPLLDDLANLAKKSRTHSSRVVTVCQHIHCMRYLDIFESAGVTDIFWSHTPKKLARTKIRIHPFPLYAVNYSSAWKPWHERMFDINFIGAKADNWYLTDTRNHILERIPGSERCIISGNSEWFFNSVVYEKQISSNVNTSNPVDTSDKAAYYTYLLGESIFTICPSGTGPNTIRVWESILSGSIPIILSDHWKTPGNFRLWRKSCIFLPDSDQGVNRILPTIRNLLANPMKISEMQGFLKELMLLYGPETFVTDIYELASRYESALEQA